MIKTVLEYNQNVQMMSRHASGIVEATKRLRDNTLTRSEFDKLLSEINSSINSITRAYTSLKGD